MRTLVVTDSLSKLAFALANLCAMFGLWALVFAPAGRYFDHRDALIHADKTRLARLQSIVKHFSQKEASPNAPIDADDFLHGEIGAAGALDALLQQNLEDKAKAAKARVSAVQALSQRRFGAQAYIGARIELSGVQRAIFAAAYEIENSHPLLLITQAILRPKAAALRRAGAEPQIDAQFDVYGPVRWKKPHAPTAK